MMTMMSREKEEMDVELEFLIILNVRFLQQV